MTPLFAHDFWIEPQTFRPPVGSVLAIRLRVGQNFEGDAVPRAERLISRFVMVTEGGEAPVGGPDASEPAGRVHVEAAGPALLGYRSLTTAIELEPAKFESYLADEGLEAVIKSRADRGESQKPGKEIYSRCAKSLIEAVPGGGAASSVDPEGAPKSSKPGKAVAAKDKHPLYGRALGFTLEIVPLADPDVLKAGASLPVQILFEDKPIANILVVAMNADNPANKIKARTDKTGHASLNLDRAGIWLVKAVHMRPAPKDSGADWESLWASLTFEMPEP